MTNKTNILNVMYAITVVFDIEIKSNAYGNQGYKTLCHLFLFSFRYGNVYNPLGANNCSNM